MDQPGKVANPVRVNNSCLEVKQVNQKLEGGILRL